MKNIVIVDAYAPTRRLAPHFRDAGFSCVRVQSSANVPAVYRSPFVLDDFAENIVHSGSLHETLSKLAAFRPVAVIAGGETGVELADALSEGLGLLSNGTRLSAARRDKYTMIETVRAAGLRAATQLLIRSKGQLQRWHEQIGGRIVVKPVRSAANDGVHFCDSPEEAVAAYEELLGKENVFSESNEAVVAQEYLVGTEYFLNTVSCAGQMHVCDIWRTVRADVNGIPDLLSGFYIIPFEGAIQQELVSYAAAVLDALEIQYGPAHIEIKMTPAGPCLVEVGARIGGADSPYYAELATGESQLNWNVDAYINPERFDDRCSDPYRIRQHFASVVMLSPRKGTLRSYPFMSNVKQLESLHDIRVSVQPGDPITYSVDDTTSPMSVNLRHPAEGVVMRDMATLRYLDGPAFYDVV
ncbi:MULTISPECIES: ATP-grasp domain-containing protein [Streptomyces]|uniref:ATP-grasp domain-containing protein n=1 Tax=Streptomyces TaxID=1883 RepID=UPI00163CA02A|nr:MULTISPECIES: ATP-grasp domain-containing protein [Streptomyces]MBC2879865.1 ATP-grasp domain-containing protein [Streptomyces sp. TYQ1024]UBI35609.1 ATP-grasp domain-containing protein [Streptomyces mobaraensis]UKW28204.1 ATP-grasp domain-containing protein [Streptomyces sp. TYQ1024]